MNEPDWAKLLNYLYQTPGELYITEAATPESKSTDIHFQDMVKEKVNFSSKVEGSTVFAHMLRDMEGNNLISVERDDKSITISLTSKGFDVAHDREQKREQSKNNQAIVILTVALAFIALVDVSIAAAIGAGYSSITLIFPLLASLFLLGLTVSLSRRDMLPE